MIYAIFRKAKIKPESKSIFEKNVSLWIDEVKKEEYNLSFDGYWVNDNTFIFMERWSTLETYKKFTKKDEVILQWKSLAKYFSEEIKTYEGNTIC
ncbi:hypothetical protein [Mycoplasmopsis fermentans]|uniref:hypothetical protein n=1 Tax=Mycoplasmopsis fermentans TaxID=2115 RepID=UPI000F027F1A|nr:hypothetical protein [Mycoplasmopsis fermentans]RMX34813.1 hypothetical protein MFI1_0739 [Mycoplasmopsis fermentans MF-I1]RMX34877.1 hypothetical protein MFI2_0713 [Mycoplasmopsis fermentans MF-I2]